MKFTKDKIIGLSATVIFHALLVLLLVFVVIEKPEPQEEGGVEVMMGFVELAQGEVPPMQGEPSMENVSEPVEEVAEEEPVITQEAEPTVSLDNKKKHEEKPVKKEKTEEEIRREKEKKAADNANKLISGAFGKGNAMGSSGTGSEGKGQQGSVGGNSASGLSSGIGGHGSWKLEGRSLGTGSLPSPSYNVKEEGTVVVDIWVNPAGNVVRTSINLNGTKTSSPELKNAAEKAAKRAKFNAVSGVDLQKGTITYVFNLR